ncbi:MAG TPA: 4a-hydroxytetrahydrobiopterin dehydratase [Gaiellaceae bacterium]|jgi:4a-hydroxytetrahydrobiopterin dehydratase
MSVPEGWREEDAALVREFELDSFSAAIAFVQRLADLAERENHHPDMDIRYRRVVVHWSTHSAGRVTDRDRELAARTSELA